MANILVVDDELPVCKSIAGALADEGYTVDTVLSAEEAIRKEEASHYDVIITDLMMPGLSGMDLLKTLKARESEARVIMITGYPSIESAVQSIKFGAFDYIPKPFTPSELRSLVSRALESKRYADEEEAGRPAPAGTKEREIAPPGGLHSIPKNSWARLEDDGSVRIGAHHSFLRTIENITSVELPKTGQTRYQGEACIRITDSQKHVHRVWMPVSGRIIAVNEDIATDPSSMTDDPYGQGWILLVKATSLESDLKNLTSF